MTCKIISFVFSFVLFGCESCKDDPKPKTELEKLPAATQVGKNTFGCLVNGKAWVTENSIKASSYYQEGTLFITADLPTQSMDMTVNELGEYVVRKQAYDLTNLPHAAAGFRSWYDGPTCFYDIENTIDGTLTITKFDQNKLIVSGVFEFTTVVSGCDTIRVTNGRFDLTYAN